MSKELARTRRSKKLRAKLQKVEIMRISISRSLKNITAQLIDSSNGKVLATVSTQQKALKSKNGGNIEAATKVGGEIAKKAISKKTGARGLRSILENILLKTMFELPDMENVVKVTVDSASVKSKSEPIVTYGKKSSTSVA